MLMQNEVVVPVKKLPELTFNQKESDEFSNMFSQENQSRFENFE